MMRGGVAVHFSTQACTPGWSIIELKLMSVGFPDASLAAPASAVTMRIVGSFQQHANVQK